MSDSSKGNIVSWIRGIGQRYLARRGQELVIHRATDMIVEVADPRIRQVGRYKKILRSPVMEAMEYCSDLVDSIPGPVRLNRQQYHTDPLVKALFSSADELDELLRLTLKKSGADQGEGADFIALLTMSRQEKTIFRHEHQGNIILRDVKQRSVNFTDHRLVASSGNLEKTKDLLKKRGLELLATIAMERIESLRGELAELRERREYLKSMRRMLNGRSRTQELFSRPDHETLERLAKLKKLISEVESDVDTAREKIEMPRDSLVLLQDIIARPEDILIAYEQTLRLDWMNVLLSSRDASKGNDISLTELSIDDELRRSAVLVNFSPQKSTEN